MNNDEQIDLGRLEAQLDNISVRSDATETDLDLLRHFSLVTLCLSRSHAHYSRWYSKMYQLITIIIALSGATSTFFALSSIFIDGNVLEIITAGLTTITTFFGGLLKTYKPMEKCDDHKKASNAYLSKHYEIRYQKMIGRENVNLEYIQKLSKELENLRTSTRSVDDKIYDEQYQELKNKESSQNNISP